MSDCKKFLITGTVLATGAGALVLKDAQGNALPAVGGATTLPNYVKTATDAAGNDIPVSAAGELVIPAETAAETPFTPIAGNAATDTQTAIANIQTAVAAAASKCGYPVGQGLVVGATGCIEASGSPAIKAVKNLAGTAIAPDAAGAVTVPAQTAAQTPFTPIAGNTATETQAAITNTQGVATVAQAAATAAQTAATTAQSAAAAAQLTANAAAPKCGYVAGQGLVVDAAGCIASSGSPAIKGISTSAGVAIAPSAAGIVTLPAAGVVTPPTFRNIAETPDAPASGDVFYWDAGTNSLASLAAPTGANAVGQTLTWSASGVPSWQPDKAFARAVATFPIPAAVSTLGTGWAATTGSSAPGAVNAAIGANGITIQVPGIYQLSATAGNLYTFTAPASNLNNAFGMTINGVGVGAYTQDAVTSTSAIFPEKKLQMTSSVLVKLAAGDVVNVSCFVSALDASSAQVLPANPVIGCDLSVVLVSEL